MTDTNIERPNFEDMDIAKLRQYASFMKVTIPKTASKEEIIAAISSKQGQKSALVLADNTTRVPPGHAKIRILEDSTPGAKNYPIYMQVNGWQGTIPRGKDIIVPMRLVRALNDATVSRMRQIEETDERGRSYFKTETVHVPSYPFQVIEMTPGPEPLTPYERAKQKTQGPKTRFKKKFGYYPRPGQLHRAIEAGLIDINQGEELDQAEENFVEMLKSKE